MLLHVNGVDHNFIPIFFVAPILSPFYIFRDKSIHIIFLSSYVPQISVTDIGCEGRCEADGDIVHLPTTGQVVNKPIFTAIIIIIILIILIIIILILLFMWFKCGFKERYGYKINMDFKKRFNFGDKFSTYRLSGVDADGKVPPEEEDSEDQEEYEDEKGSVMTGTEASFNVKPNLNSHNQKKDWRSKEDIDHISNATSSASNRAPVNQRDFLRI